MFERWAREHERAFLTTFFTLTLPALGFVAVRAALDGHARGHRRVGRSLCGRVEDRRRQAEINVFYALIGGALTAIAPVMLWIAFVLRPDQHPDEDL